VEDFAINILNIDFQNSPNMTYQSENWGNPIEPFSVGSYTVSLKIKDLQSKININSLVLNNSDINYIQLERLCHYLTN
jgi:type II secretory pathway component PulK